jgi:amidohydrolase
MSTIFDTAIKRVLPDIVAFRRELHANPELSWHEHETARRIRELLGRLPNVRVQPPILGTDVVAMLNADRPGPCIAIRADIDALPIVEDTGVPYTSTKPGVMHACGHDGHTAVLAGTATVLSAMADSLPGKVKFIFQPAEEDDGGGGKLCEKGVLDGVDAAIALHAWPMQSVGTIAVRHGPVTAANNELTIVVKGRGGHGAYPQRCIDPILISAEILMALQTIVSRSVAPLDCAVVTVGCIQGGATTNVIPPECAMRGTIRYYKPETGEMVRKRVHEIATHIAQAHGAEAEVSTKSGYPPLLNADPMADLMVKVGTELLGPDNVITTEDPSMGAEDFAFYAQKVPAAMFRLGVRPREMDTYPGGHHPKFNFNDDAIPTGISMFCELTRRFLSGKM